MDDLSVSLYYELECGRRILLTNYPGSAPAGVAKNGNPQMIEWDEGSIVLASPTDEVIAGPIDVVAALRVAEGVVSGNPRALTEPSGTLILATTLLVIARVLRDTQAEAKALSEYIGQATVN
ncbi:hypothetical protein G6L78_01265 [Agrobacterium rhizogenes]|nr:hypothetical protein [Rhizobium rhizogenes]